jgi:hypothetical protein
MSKVRAPVQNIQSYSEIKYPDAALVQTNLTGALSTVQDDPDNPDVNWMTSAGAIELRVSFPSPTGTPIAGAKLQTFRIRVRPGS